MNIYFVHEYDESEGYLVAAETAGKAKMTAMDDIWANYTDLRAQIVKKNVDIKKSQMIYAHDTKILQKYGLTEYGAEVK